MFSLASDLWIGVRKVYFQNSGKVSVGNENLKIVCQDFAKVNVQFVENCKGISSGRTQSFLEAAISWSIISVFST